MTLDTIRIATPCSADWNEMKGDDRSRFCGHCSLNVYNLSEMSRTEAQAFVEQAEGRVCVRFYRRADGTVITQDCPVGVRAVQERMMRRVRSVAAAITAFVAGIVGINGVAASEPELMGKMVRPHPSQPADTASAPVDSAQSDSTSIDPPEDGSDHVMIMGGLMPPPEVFMGEPAQQPVDTVMIAEPSTVDEPVGDETIESPAVNEGATEDLR
jgi:hypothetical protein